MSARVKDMSSVVAVGTFDGVHLGHQAVLRSTVAEARSRGGRSVTVTFGGHPLSLLHPSEAPPLLTSTAEKVALIESCGVDEVCVLPFEREIAEMPAEGFVSYLLERFSCRCLVMGYDNAVGRGRVGTPAYLENLTGPMGFELRVVGPVEVNGIMVSSSEVRKRLSVGDVATAGALLGHRYHLTSAIVHGDGRGSTLGVATANLPMPPGRAVPMDGVYATWADLPGRDPMMSVTNIGVRPTFYGPGNRPLRTIEVHLLDAHDRIYGSEMRIEFAHFLRAERRFGSSGELVEQIHSDIAISRQLLPGI